MIPLALPDGQIVYAGDPDAHQTVLVELPIFIAVAAEPVAAIVAPFVGEAHGDTVLPKCPELLDQPVVELATPLARQERLDFITALQKFDAIAPATIRRVSQRHPRAIARVPRVFRHAYLLRGRFCGERRKWRLIHFQFLYIRAKKDRDRSPPGSVSARDSATRESCAHSESHFTAENTAGASNWLLMFSTSWPSFSVLATTATHSGSARKAPQHFSRSGMLSQASM